MNTKLACKWLRTMDAAGFLGVHPDTLLRRRDSSGGYYIAGKHYLHGPTPNSPIRWNVEACLAADHQQGIKARKSHLQQQGKVLNRMAIQDVHESSIS